MAFVRGHWRNSKFVESHTRLSRKKSSGLPYYNGSHKQDPEKEPEKKDNPIVTIIFFLIVYLIYKASS